MGEFGKGYAYCLGLFLAHAERPGYIGDDSLWYNSAADHLFEIQIPSALTEDKKREVKAWVDRMIWYRNKYDIPKDERKIHIDTAKRFLLEWDKACGIECEKGVWE